MCTMLRTVGCAVALGCVVASPAYAQRSAPEPASVRRPYRGIFGAPPDPAAPQSLVVSASAYGAYDDNIVAGLSDGRIRNSWLQRSGNYWGASGAVNYNASRHGERVTFETQNDAQLQYRQAGASHVSPYYTGDLALDVRLTRSVTLGLQQAASYQPAYSLSLSPLGGQGFGSDIGVVPDPDLALFPLQAFRAATTATLSKRLGPNTVASAGYNFRTITIGKSDANTGQSGVFRDYRAHAGTVRIEHSKPVSPNAALILGYGVRVSDRGGMAAEPRLFQNLNAGVNYSRPLSFSRRTTFSFTSGSTLVSGRNLQQPDASGRQRFRFFGNADLNQEMGRTWTGRLSYARGLVSQDGFGSLYFTDAVTTTLEGLVSRRLSLQANGIWSHSTIDVSGRNGHTRTSATAQATYALSRFLAVYTRYVYYQYQYGQDVALDPRLARGLDRQGVRLGLTTSVPLIR